MMAQIRTRKRGKTWSYIFEAGIVNGKRKVVEKGGFPTRNEAYKAGVAAFNDYLHGNIGITSEKISLKDFMTAWLDNVVALNVKANTIQTYRSVLNVRILPHLGEVKVQDLTPATLDAWIRKLVELGFSHSSLSVAHSIIRDALDYAVQPAQLISSNPAPYIKIPKNTPKNIIKRTIITPEQFKSLLDKYPFGTPMYIPLLLLYHTGMRRSEVLGLTWSDIDFVAKRITVHEQISYISRRGYFFTTLKTKSSNRYIIVDDFLLGELKRWQNQQLENEKQFGGSYVYIYREKDGHIERRSKSLPAPVGEKVALICTRKTGDALLKGTLTRILKSEGLNAHSFRHTHATQLIESGAKPKGVAGRLGHSNIFITQNLYTHNTEKLQEETAAIFDKNLQTNH